MSALIAYRNDADTGTVTAPAMPGYPASNVQERQLSSVLRMSTSSTKQITVDLGSAKTVRLIGLLGVNCDFGGANTTSVQRSSNGTNWTTVPVVWPTDAPSAAKARSSRDVSPALYAIIAPTSARYWRITTNWARYAGDAFYEVGRVWLGDALVLADGVDAQWELGATDAGRLDISAGLQAYEDPRPRARRIALSVTGVNTMTAFGFGDDDTHAADVPSAQALTQEAGTTGEVIVLPRTSSPLWIRRLGVYGHMTDMPRIRHMSGPNYAIDLRVTEER